MRVKLANMPDPKKQGVITLQNLHGGLNLHEDPTHVASNQSPDMLNMWYRDGMLKRRAGQEQMYAATGGGDGQVWFYDGLFNGLIVFVSGNSIKYFNPNKLSEGQPQWIDYPWVTRDSDYMTTLDGDNFALRRSIREIHTVDGVQIPSSQKHGVFFAFDEHLYYKAKGIYLRLSYDNGLLTAENILWSSGSGYAISSSVYTPVVIINRNPDGTGGELYQPENRINPKKTVWFDIDAESTDYYLPVHGCTVTSIQVNDDIVDTSNTTSRTFSIGGRTVTIHDENIADTSLQYTRLTFSTALYSGTATKMQDINIATTPAVLSNKLRVTYSKDNPDAIKAIADCKYATSFGGTDAVCVVMGNCEKQQNAIFWSGNGSYGVDATYFPMDQYNLCGAYQDPVTGFGKQQSVLIVFQKSHVSRATYRLNEVNDRKYIDLTLNTINSEFGCDMPWSIALCGNNLVWIHSKYGVLYLRDTSSAYENMIVVISRNVNGNYMRQGLLADLKDWPEHQVVGVEDGQRYYVFVRNNMWCWDFSISSVSDGLSSLSWSKHTGFSVQAATTEADTGFLWLMNSAARITRMSDGVTTDYGEVIPCYYRTPTHDFGGYGRIRTVQRVVVSILNNPDSEITIRYGGEGQDGMRLKGHAYLPRIINAIKTLSGAFLVTKNGANIVTELVDYHPDEPQSGEFWMPMVLKPRAIRVNNFWLEIQAKGGLAINQVTIAYTTHSLTK